MEKLIPILAAYFLYEMQNAPGELPDTPPGVKFKIGYFSSIESALQWEVTSSI